MYFQRHLIDPQDPYFCDKCSRPSSQFRAAAAANVVVQTERTVDELLLQDDILTEDIMSQIPVDVALSSGKKPWNTDQAECFLVMFSIQFRCYQNPKKQV